MEPVGKKVTVSESKLDLLFDRIDGLSTVVTRGFEKVDHDFIVVNQQLVYLNEKIDTGLLHVNLRIDALQENTALGFEKIEKQLGDVNLRVDELQRNTASSFEKMEKSIWKVTDKVDHGLLNVEDRIDALRGNSITSLESIEIKLDDLKIEISKINDVTSYEGIFENSKGLKKR